MRIISGNFKGKKILLPKDKLTRPLKDLTKESIFNILKHSKLLNVELENSNILDLFSGVGSFGLECLSRGAKNVTFLESYGDVLSILKKNIDNLNQQNQTKVIEKDFVSMSSMKQWILEEDIGKMCSFLISDDSSKVSGQVISVDGHTERND